MAKTASLYPLGLMATFLEEQLGFEREEAKGVYEVGRWRGRLGRFGERVVVAYDRDSNVHGEPISEEHRSDPNKQVRVVVQGQESRRLQSALRGRYIDWKRGRDSDE